MMFISEVLPKEAQVPDCFKSFADAMCEPVAESVSDTDVEIVYWNLVNKFHHCPPGHSQSLPRSPRRLRSKFKHLLAIVVVQLRAVDKLLSARLAHRRREEDHRETIRACGQPMQQSTIGRAHVDLHRR